MSSGIAQEAPESENFSRDSTIPSPGTFVRTRPTEFFS